MRKPTIAALPGPAAGAGLAIALACDMLGKDFANAFKGYLKDDFDKKVVASSYEVTEPMIDSQVVKLAGSRCS